MGLYSKSLKKILPIFKNIDKLDITNSRPISILHVISKVYEKVFYQKLYNYFSVKTYYHHNLVSDQVLAPNRLYWNFLMIFWSCLIRKLAIATTFTWISVKRLTVFIILFYYLNSNDMESMQLHCNGSTASYHTVNTALQWTNSILSDGEHCIAMDQQHPIRRWTLHCNGSTASYRTVNTELQWINSILSDGEHCIAMDQQHPIRRWTLHCNGPTASYQSVNTAL